MSRTPAHTIQSTPEGAGTHLAFPAAVPLTAR